MVDVSNSCNLYCIDSPVSSWVHNKIDLSPPPSPTRVPSLVSADRVLQNIDALCAPSFDDNSPRKTFQPLSFQKIDNPLLRDAFNRLRNGPARETLRNRLREFEEANRDNSLVGTPPRSPEPIKGVVSNTKASSHSAVVLGRQPPERRNSGMARSA